MSIQFSHIVDAVYKLPLVDREELKNLLEHNILEARREEIAATFEEAKAEERSAKLKFSSNISALKKAPLS